MNLYPDFDNFNKMKCIKCSCLILVLIFGTFKVFSQCINFARSIAKPQLETYTHDGNYNATYIEEGESAELYKTFFSGQQYRLVLAAVNALPKNIRIRILDEQLKILFDNADHNYTYIWDFTAESTQKLTIHIKIPDNEKNDKITGGCIAILFGIKISDRKNRN